MMIDWDKALLRKQYNADRMTLQDIGEHYGVTRERVRQVMEEFGLNRNSHREHKLPPPRYKNLNDFLTNKKRTGKWDDLTLAWRFIPPDTTCSECGYGRSLVFHHIVYPATSVNDVQILCRSCHKLKHKGRMTHIRQLSLWCDYNDGISYQDLALKYDISKIAVAKIIHKIRNGNRTYRG